jgi:zinc/manganese transport system ATP-binding protein
MGAVNPITFDRVELRHGGRVIVTGLGFVLRPGSLTAVVGPNGSGKTTLLRAIAGLHPVTAGRIDLGGTGRQQVALLAQGSHLDRSFPITCLDVVALAAPRLGQLRAVGRDGIAAARAALDRVGLAGFENRKIQALSAGQFQRVLFARTIVQDASLILLDEPFTAVDDATTGLLLSVVRQWHAQGRTVVAVLHDMGLVRQHFTDVLALTGQPSGWNFHRASGLPQAA